MIKKTAFTLALSAAMAAIAPAALAQSTGDVMFTSFNADEDGWAMVSFVDLAPNTTIYFTDNEWSGAGFNTGESYHQWNTGAAAIAAGSVIRFSAIDTTSLAASVGTLSRATVTGSANYGMSQTEDTLYAYIGASATSPTTFLGAVSSSTYGTLAGGSLTNTGLSVGSGAVQLSFGSDFAQYNGPRTGLASFADYRPLVSNVANWQDSGDGSFATSLPNITPFSITPVPEAGAAAQILAGMFALGFVAVRRRQR